MLHTSPSEDAYHLGHAFAYVYGAMAQPKRETNVSIQVAVRLPKELYAWMLTHEKPIARQVIEALEKQREADRRRSARRS
jgi:hypothetical protein